MKDQPLLSFKWLLTATLLSVVSMSAFVLGTWLIKPSLIWAAEIKFIEVIAGKAEKYPLLASLVPQPILLAPEEMPLPAWKPYDSHILAPATIRIGERNFDSLGQAANALKNGDVLIIGAGVYKQSLVIKADNVTLVGEGHVIFDGNTTQGKGAIVIDGNNVTIRNIECRNIKVPDQNGSCIRQQGKNLTVEHVYFHDSQQGILTGQSPGRTEIFDSRFENLGYGGRAHGIYIGGGSLNIENSVFLRSRGQGHEIKSRAETTRIYRSVIASLDGEDSRLVDLPYGGDISIEQCVLEQGPNSANYNLVGVGLEGRLHERQQLVLRNNIFILERQGEDLLLQTDKTIPPAIASGNLVIGGNNPKWPGQNIYIKTRLLAQLPPFPFLPKPPDGSPIPW